MKKFSLIIIISLGLLLSACSSATSTTSEQKAADTVGTTSESESSVAKAETDTLATTEIPVPTSTPAPTNTPEPTNTPRPTYTPTATPDPNFVKSGIYLVGSEINPGLYKGMSDGCYWERLKDLSGGFDAIVANGNSDGQFYIHVKEGDYAVSFGCDVVLLDPMPGPVEEFPEELDPGVFLVGIDIKAGLYKGMSDGCYWERLQDVAGGFDGIIANGNSNGQYYIEVKDGDFAFSTNCRVVLLDPIPEHNGEYPQVLDPGMYIVSLDIQPGTYKGTAEGCYWERLSNLAGGFKGIIANGNSNGQFYIQVSKSDYAISTTCQIERVGD